MKLEEFVCDQTEMVLEFSKNWREYHDKKPEAFPVDDRPVMFWLRQYLNHISRQVEEYYEAREKAVTEAEIKLKEDEEKLLKELQCKSIITTENAA